MFLTGKMGAVIVILPTQVLSEQVHVSDRGQSSTVVVIDINTPEWPSGSSLRSKNSICEG